jgi:hypothetical protein
MASILRVNTLTDASSNNSIATSTIFNGSAKAWASYGGTSQATKDSYNVASITDESTDGVISYSLTNAFSNKNYAIAFSSGYGDHFEARNTSGQSSNDDFGGRTTSSFTYSGAMDTSGNRQETHDHSLSIHGDLA